MSNYDDLGALEGRVRHCLQWKGTKRGKRCASYAAGPGKPRGRKAAGIKRRFYEQSTTRKRAHKICFMRKVKGQARRKKVCRFVKAAAWRQHVSAARCSAGVRRTRTGRKHVMSARRRKPTASQIKRRTIGARKKLASAEKALVKYGSVGRQHAAMAEFSGLERVTRRRRKTSRRRARRR